MCEPTTIILGTAAIVSAYSAYNSAEAQKKAAEYNAKINETNAKVEEEQAAKRKVQAEANYKAESEDLRRRISSTKGSQKSALAASGVSVGSGSALDILKDTDYLGEQDALTLKRNLKYEVEGIVDQANINKSNYLANAKLSRMQAPDPYAAAGTSLLIGASQMATYH